ncbi:MAG: FAD:protein FMN transferase [Proteobacteria bacterium]|nr:FAD:protein FMN transferase [Pseudomonadota bacterium]
MYRSIDCRLIKPLLIGVILLAGCEQQPHLVEQRILQFGTVIDVSLVHHDLAKSEQTLIEIEQLLSAYRQSWHAWEDSELSRFNLALGSSGAVKVPASLLELITLSQRYYLSSNRLFNPALGKLIAAYGFHGQADIDEELIKIIQRDLPTMADLEIQDRLAISRNPHLQLDFGGIAKGYAIGLIASHLDRLGFEHYLINAGGDLITSGNKLGKAWRIGVKNPFEPGAIASIGLLGKQALFTSGNYQRFYLNNDETVHHIIDPRSGEPSKHISSATVLTSDPVLADVAATTLMIDGLNNYRSLAGSLGIEDYMIIDDQQRITISGSLAGKIELSAGLMVTIVDQ